MVISIYGVQSDLLEENYEYVFQHDASTSPTICKSFMHNLCKSSVDSSCFHWGSLISNCNVCIVGIKKWTNGHKFTMNLTLDKVNWQNDHWPFLIVFQVVYMLISYGKSIQQHLCDIEDIVNYMHIFCNVIIWCVPH